MGCFCSGKVNITQPSHSSLQIVPLNSHQRPPLPRSRDPSPPKPTVVSPKVKLDSKFTIEDIKFSDITPASTQKVTYPYSCPICFKFLSVILTAKCCKNYICHFCINDLQNKNLNFEITCPHCKAQPLCAIDVELGATIKKYSDSPYTSQFNNNQTNKWVPGMSVVEEDKEDPDPHHDSFVIVQETEKINNLMYSTA